MIPTYCLLLVVTFSGIVEMRIQKDSFFVTESVSGSISVAEFVYDDMYTCAKSCSLNLCPGFAVLQGSNNRKCLQSVTPEVLHVGQWSIYRRRGKLM